MKDNTEKMVMNINTGSVSQLSDILAEYSAADDKAEWLGRMPGSDVPEDIDPVEDCAGLIYVLKNRAGDWEDTDM
jgi:hypothetical protein